MDVVTLQLAKKYAEETMQGAGAIKGDKGDPGPVGPAGPPGPPGNSPYIGSNGNWWIGNTDTDVPASGEGSADAVTVPGSGTIEVPDSLGAGPYTFEFSEEDSGGESAWEIYSTEETRIGTWIDGKPLYRKTFQVTTPTTLKKHTEVYNGPKNVDFVSNIYGTITGLSLDGRNSISSVNYANYCFTTYNKDDEKTMMWVESSYQAGKIAYVTIEYTKTTDQTTTSVLSNTVASKNNANFALNLPQQSVAFSPVTVSNITEEEE